jgi:FAD/FMN-containing dehydrogenase
LAETRISHVRSACNATIETIRSDLPIARVELVDALSVTAFNTYTKLARPERPTLLVEFHGSDHSVAEKARCFGEIADDDGGGGFGLVAPIVGHVGDSNIHVSPIVDMGNQAEIDAAEAFPPASFFAPSPLGDTSTGEHGFGQKKMCL